MFINHILKSVSLRNGLFILFVLGSLSSLTQDFDPFYYSSQYPSEDFILLKYSVEIELLDTEDGVKCKTKHRKEYLTLEDDVTALNRFLLTFSESQELKVKMARVYAYEDGKKKLINNVKTKWLKARDHYINGVFYNDIKDYEIATDRQLNKHTHITLEYEVIDNDLKFINPIYVANYGEHVVDFSVKLKEPYDAVIDLVPFNTEEFNFVLSEEDGYTTYSVKDLPNLQGEGNQPPYNYIAPHFVPVVREIEGQKYLAATEDLYNWYKELISQVEMNSELVKKLSVNLTYGMDTDEQKIEAIFKYVQSKIDYLAFEDGIAGFRPTKADEVLYTGYGDCKGMSNLLVDLLRNADINCGHAWIGTRRLNYSYDLAALCVDNHMVCWVKLEDELHILDATGLGHVWNRIPSHLQGKQMMLGLEDSYEIVEVPIAQAEDNTIAVKASVSLNDTTISDVITGSMVISGNEAIDYFMTIQNLSVRSPNAKGDWIVYRFLDGAINEVQVTELTYDDTKHQLSLEFSGTVIGSKVKSGKDIYYYSKLSQYVIEMSNYNQPAYFDNAFVFTSDITYALENGMKINALPPAIAFGTDLFSLDYECTQSGSIISENRRIKVNTIYSGASEKAARRTFVDVYNKSLKEPFHISK